MSKFNSYAKKLDEIAKDYFFQYRAAKTAFDSEQKRYAANRKPSGNGVWKTDAAEIARLAKIEADYAQAKANLEYVERTLASEVLGKISDERQKLAADAETAFFADPAKVDAATITLLNSGILGATEYAHLMDSAESACNYTMMRLIGQAAGKARAAMNDTEVASNGAKRREAVELTGVCQRGHDVGPGRYLEDFDNATAIFKRSMNNPNIAEKWEEYTKNFVENF